MEQTVEKLLELIEVVVDEPGMTWQEKAAAVRSACGPDDESKLAEFVSWFTPDEE